MGIESDQLVFDYLSRVGDLAQQRGLPAAARMQLVAGLRARIDAQKPDTVPGVKRMLARLGTPEAVVTAARTGDAPPEAEAAGSRPGWRTGLLGKIPGPRDGAPRPGFLRKPARPAPEPDPGGAPPHLAGADELGEADDPPDWWRVEASPYAAQESVPGFIGGIELPEVWERPKAAEAAEAAGSADEPEGADDADPEDGRRRLPRLLRRALARRGGAPDPDTPAAEATDDPEDAPEEPPASPWAWLSPVPALAVVLLLAGAVVGSWLALAGGWGLLYVSRRLTRAEVKFAVLGVPGVALCGLLVWLWGRAGGRWGDRVAPGAVGQALLDGLPGVARVAAVLSSGYVLWRLRLRRSA
ncbi:hypothetical protein [Streptomyces natalensis]|uniref:Uncharacterized protein n=1 Tax=Streptomyces natalensis ATCC 27448 TaxID=1240678 RepID=A0A0D7CCJ6_9ACTN|nr:hypothetical protein [Streptomyces natalensis]KIZ13630.1 hypothetical protein SNA_37055 [Streptomyces natalensis ATCC 27448]